jgi:hypothetical protein
VERQRERHLAAGEQEVVHEDWDATSAKSRARHFAAHAAALVTASVTFTAAPVTPPPAQP